MGFETSSFESKDNKKEIKTGKEIINWPKIKEYSRLLILTALLTASGLSTASAQESNNTQKEKFNTEQLQEKASQEVKKVYELVFKSPDVLVGTVDQTKSREWESKNKEEIVEVGYQADGVTPKWIIYENNNGAKLYFDDNADGSVDRVIVNNEVNKEGNSQLDNDEQKAISELDAFGSIESLARKAETIAGLKPREITVAEINSQNGHSTLQIVDFESGQSGEISPEHGDEIVNMIQAAYIKGLESAASQISK